jgi:hypothetical protein
MVPKDERGWVSLETKGVERKDRNLIRDGGLY